MTPGPSAAPAPGRREPVLLAVERSADTGGAALFRGARRLVSLSLDAVSAAPKAPDAAAPACLAAIPALLAEAGVAPTDIDRFVVGVGPGSFSGIRGAIAFLTGLSLPAGKSVEGYESPAVVAATLAELGLLPPAEGDPAEPVCAIVGDARRGFCWVAPFRADPATGIAAAAPLALVPYERLAGALPTRGVVATPDWKRLAIRLREIVPAGRLVEGPVAPAAEALARRALATGPDCVPARPRYLHPAVAAR